MQSSAPEHGPELATAETVSLPRIKDAAHVRWGMNPPASLSLFWGNSIAWLANHTLVWHFAGLGLVLILMAYFFPTTVTALTLNTDPSGPISIPITFSSEARAYTLEGILNVDWRPSTRHLTLRADDCVELISVDGRVIYRNTCGQCSSCTPFKVNLPQTVDIGRHDFVIRVRNLRDLAFLDIRQAHGLGWIEVGIIMLAALGWLGVVRLRRLSMWAWWGAIIPLLIAIGYFLATDMWLRQMDVAAHRDYLAYVQTMYSLPRVGGGESVSPPLYYFISLAWTVFGNLISAPDSWRWLQVLALVAYAASISVAALAWKELSLKSGWLGYALYALLPAQVFLVARINNDVLLPLWGTVITLALWRNSQHGSAGTSWFAALALLGAVATKMSSVPLVAGAAVFLWFSDRAKGRSVVERLAHLAIVLLPGVIWISIWGLRSLIETGNMLYNPSDNLAGGLAVGNGAFHFMSFDYRAALTEVYPNTWGGQIRQSLPTFLLSSALFGEFNFGFTQFPFASFLVAFFILVAVFLLVGYMSAPQMPIGRPTFLAFVLVSAHLLFFLVYNWRYPFSSDEDARLWAPVFLPLAILWSSGYRTAVDFARGLPRFLMRATPLVFFILLAAFYFYLIVP